MAVLGNDSVQAESLRAALTRNLVAEGTIRDERVAAAFRTVPRHVFIPHAPLDIAYADDVVLMKRNQVGVVISSVSQPSIVALMLEQAAVRLGDRVLEIGSGGYNAALLRELAGPDGAVTTVDIDPEVTERARALLDQAGYGDVVVLLADGEFGAPDGAPYDRIVVTVTAWDIARAWLAQLRVGGRIVVPLRVRGQTRSIAFDRIGDHLESRSTALCGFVCMQGAGSSYERHASIKGDQVWLSFDEDQEGDPHPSDGVMAQPPRQSWSGVRVGRDESLLDLNLWLATALPGYCVLSGGEDAVPSVGAAAVATSDSVAYVAGRPDELRPDELVELGSCGHGPDAADLMEGVIDQVRIWDEHYRQGPGPAFRVDAGDVVPLRGLQLARRHGTITVSWAG